MQDRTVGAALRMLRLRRGWRQVDLATRSGVSLRVVRRAEHGRLENLDLERLRAIATPLDAHVGIDLHWRGAELDRLLNRRHSSMHEAMARWFETLPGWTLVPEASFAIYGERGIIDGLAFHQASRTLLVIELKTDIVDVQELIGNMDRKRRLAPRVANQRGWQPKQVAAWVVVAPSRTTERRIAAHQAVLRAAFPADGRHIVPWLRRPRSVIAALSLLPAERLPSAAPRHRHQGPRTPPDGDP